MYQIGPRNHFATLPTYVAPPCAIVQTAVFPEAPLKGPLHIMVYLPEKINFTALLQKINSIGKIIEDHSVDIPATRLPRGKHLGVAV